MPDVARVAEFIHFACTSEDINNLAHGLALAEARRDVLLPRCAKSSATCARSRTPQAARPMLARTHGQPATPTTLGKEIANVVARLERARSRRSRAVAIKGKMNGAVGNYNAHVVRLSGRRLGALRRAASSNALGLELNPYTTQIEPHDCMAEYSTRSRGSTPC